MIHRLTCFCLAFRMLCQSIMATILVLLRMNMALTASPRCSTFKVGLLKHECLLILNCLVHEIAGPPYWNAKPEDSQIALNGNIELLCDAGGSPNPKITWSKLHRNGIRRSFKSRQTKFANNWILICVLGFEVLGNNKVLKLSSVTRKDSGDYLCKVDNEIGSIEQKIHISVNGNG